MENNYVCLTEFEIDIINFFKSELSIITALNLNCNNEFEVLSNVIENSLTNFVSLYDEVKKDNRNVKELIEELKFDDEIRLRNIKYDNIVIYNFSSTSSLYNKSISSIIKFIHFAIRYIPIFFNYQNCSKTLITIYVEIIFSSIEEFKVSYPLRIVNSKNTSGLITNIFLDKIKLLKK